MGFVPDCGIVIGDTPEAVRAKYIFCIVFALVILAALFVSGLLNPFLQRYLNHHLNEHTRDRHHPVAQPSHEAGVPGVLPV